MYSLGIDLGGTNIVASVVDDQFNIISTAKTKTNAPRPANAIFDDVEKVCREAVREARLTMSDLVAVGMGLLPYLQCRRRDRVCQQPGL